jgi:hypothetical protein
VPKALYKARPCQQCRKPLRRTYSTEKLHPLCRKAWLRRYQRLYQRAYQRKLRQEMKRTWEEVEAS